MLLQITQHKDSLDGLQQSVGNENLILFLIFAIGTLILFFFIIRSFIKKEEERINRLYKDIINVADNFFANKKYKEAQAKYKEALRLKPEKKFLKDKLIEIDSILIDLTEKEEKQIKYNSAIAAADNALSAKKCNEAKAKYNEAMDIKPDEQYPKDKLTKIENALEELAKIEVEEKEMRENDNAAPEIFENEPRYAPPVSIPEENISRITDSIYFPDPDNNNNVQIEIIISIPEPNQSFLPKKIGYTPEWNIEQDSPYKYPIVKMPEEGSLIKFPRKGRSNKKGFTEVTFFKYLNKYFDAYFKIYNDKHLPQKNGRPYEPDFVLLNENENKNIFINIEIDEPYDGVGRVPTHCIGDDDYRDIFFTKRGWIVIRFAEIQIYEEPVKCCAFIAKVVHSIDKSYYSILLNESIPEFIDQWDSLQANKWSLRKYREEYLNIPYFVRTNIIYEYKIFNSVNDDFIEDCVKNIRTKTNLQKQFILKTKRDKRIEFDSIEHRYYIDGNPDTVSVTQLIDKFFPEFDSPYWSRKKAIDRLVSIGTEQTEDNILIMQKTILKEWEHKRIESAEKGVFLHKEIEDYYKGNNYNDNTIEFQYFLSFINQYNNLTPFITEWMIFDEDLLVAGTVDMVYKKNDGSLFIFDWKRSEKVINNDGTIKDDKFKFAFGELKDLGDNSFNKYCLQQNIYKAILEKRYEMKISSMNLLILHENYNNYIHLTIPDMQKEVNYIFNFML